MYGLGKFEGDNPVWKNRVQKLEGVALHTLSHTFASRLGMGGSNDRTVQALGKWKEPKMIQQYTHLPQEHLAEAAF